MKTKIPESVLKNSNVLTADEIAPSLEDKIITVAQIKPDRAPEDLIENGLLIVVEDQPNSQG